MGTLFYTSNNSGGDWWLSDRDWVALEKAGWHIYWRLSGRWLGALATQAAKHFEYEKVGIAEFEAITKQDSKELGCNCCGKPHYFEWFEEELELTDDYYEDCSR